MAPGTGPQQRRTLRLLLPGAFTTTFVVAVIIVVKAYQTKAVLTPSQKNAYNVLSIGFIIFLSAALLVRYESKTFKETAICLHHYINNWATPSQKTQSLVEGFDSLSNVLQLVFLARKQTLRLVCVLWLLINLIAMIAPTLQALVCTLEDGHDYTSIYTRNGSAMVPSLTCYFNGGHCAPTNVTRDQLAHAYGETTLGPKSTDPDNCGDFTDVQSIVGSKKDYRYYCHRVGPVQQFGIRFNEYNDNDNRRIYPHFTTRVITASSAKCNEYAQLGIPKPTNVGDPNTDGTNFISAFDHTYRINATTNGSIIIPTSALGNDGTTYIYRGIHEPVKASYYSYGDRGLMMWAYRNPGKDRTPQFYECPVTVDPVVTVMGDSVDNVTDPVHAISDGMAREAVASIALQGQFKQTGGGPRVFTQWQWYAISHPWNIENDASNAAVGANIAEHAIVSLAEMMANNPTTKARGKVPYLGTRLKVDWRSFAALMVGIIVYDSLTSVLGLMAIWKDPESRFQQLMKHPDEEIGLDERTVR
ncbi:uncharacterized protein KY384_008610 [Bacidia gigantensis]|uniref:uncharacterized protein n=1 Tax=Bacidia gigantensis TaxID=2732470 RepID=UPI001D05314D|nr:uncharacterized protein KY384_008610 [Bacidia gigantensis]KAG8527180.1 hypothetical protein KY384_008610 [Bacidia gigantensis]